VMTVLVPISDLRITNLLVVIATGVAAATAVEFDIVK
jgi:hypothetical protein